VLIKSKMLNLLPPKQEKKLRLRFLNRTVICFGAAIILIISSLILFLFLAQKFLNSSLEEKQAELNLWQAKPEIQELKDLEARVKGVNKNAQFLSQKLEQTTQFYLILERLAEQTPLEIRIDDLSINDTGEITVQGYSPTRNSLLIFKKNLEAGTYFTDLDFPLSNLAKTRDIDFYFSLKVAEL